MNEVSRQQYDDIYYDSASFPMINLYYKKLATITKLRELMETELKVTNLSELNGNLDKSSFVSDQFRVDNLSFLPYIKAFLAY